MLWSTVEAFSMSQDPYGQPVLRPVATSAEMWQLGASPDDLEVMAGILRSVGSAGDSAYDTIDSAARRVFGGGAWEGGTAEAYQQHRVRLARDLIEFSDTARAPARAMEEMAAVLRRGQAMLDDEWHRLAAVPRVSLPAIPPIVSGAITFLPRDDGEAGAVQRAVSAAEDIKGWVDQELARGIPELQQAQRAYQAIEGAWQPRGVTHLNLNAGMGRGGGTTRANLDELAAAVASRQVDVVTLQEVLHGNLYDEAGSPGLLTLLEQHTGERWTVAALSDPTYTTPDDPDNPDRQAYGNAVLVREGGPVVALDGSGSGAAGIGDQVPLTNPVVDFTFELLAGDNPEDRAAAVAEFEIRPRDAG